MRSKNALKNIVSSLLLQVASVICGFIVPILIIRSFGSEANGLVNSITQFLGYITLLESGFGPVVKSVLYKYIAKNDKKNITSILKSAEIFFRKIAAIFVVYILILCFVYPSIVSSQFDVFYTVSLLVIMAFGTLAEYFFGMTYTLFLQAKQKTYITSYIQLAVNILVTIAVVLLIRCGCSLQIVKLVTAALFVMKPLIQNYYVKKKYGINLRGVTTRFDIKEKWDGLAQHIAAVIHSNTDVVVITLFSTLSEVSVYTVYLLVLNGVKKIVQSFNQGVDASFGDMIAKKEMKELNRSFSIYELFYHTVTSIIFISATVLMVPFVSVYTAGVTDADYVRPVFGVLITISEFIWAVRLPYASTVLAAGHFKQTKKGAWLEAFVNIVLSVILVFHFGIVGVAIGTITAMFIRAVEFMYHNSVHILKRSALHSLLWLPIIAIETVLVFLICKALPGFVITDYLSWALYGIVVVVISFLIVLPINILTHREESKGVIELIKKNLKRSRRKKE